MSDGHNAATSRSWLATINPVAKLAATLPPLALLLFTRDIATPAVVVGLALVAIVSGVPLRLRALLAGAGAILLVGAWTTLVFALLTRCDLVRDSPIIIDGWITLRAAAVHNGASTAVRLAAMMMLALLGSLGTTTDQLASALVHQCRIPYRFAYGSIAAMRFAPRYRQELLTLLVAQRARGIIDPAGPVGYRRDHLRAFAQRVEVADDEVRIMGRKLDLLQSLVAASSGESAAFAVRSSVLKWRTRQDSNL